MSKTYIRSKSQPNTVYVIDEHTAIEDVTVSEDVEITVTMSNKKHTGDTAIECEGGIDCIISYYIPLSDLKAEKPFEFNEKGEIAKFNLKRKGTYRGKRFDRKFHKMPQHEKESK